MIEPISTMALGVLVVVLIFGAGVAWCVGIHERDMPFAYLPLYAFGGPLWLLLALFAASELWARLVAVLP